MGEFFDAEDVPVATERKITFCSEYGIDIFEWFDFEFHHFGYETVAQDVDSPKEAARKERYPMMIDKQMMLIFGLLELEREMPEARQYYFEKQWQSMALSLRRKQGSLVHCFLI